MIPKLFNILIKFRWHLIAVTADIEKAFLMISIHKDDWDMLRFLWLKEPTNIDSKVIHLRFTRLVFGLWPILGSVISHHLSEHQEQHPDLVHSIGSSLYVDDLIAGEDTVERAFRLYMQAKRLMAKGNFNLRKWNSNSQELLNQIRNFEQLSSEEELSPSLMHSPAISEENASYVKSTLGPSKPHDGRHLLSFLR